MTGPAPALAAVRRAVRAACADLRPGDLVLVACSGGPDSTALATAAGWLAAREPWRAGAVVVDHGLQVGSADVARAAAATCSHLGLHPVDIVTVDVRQGREGPEAAARTARHAALEAAAIRHHARAVLLGHTLDDQAEQVLLGLARGSGARSLAGMPGRRGLLRRPLLALERRVTLDACAAAGLVTWTDPGNTDPGFARSRVRARVMPVLERELGPGVAAALARTADQLREDAEVLEELAADLLLRARRGDATHPPDHPSAHSDGRPVGSAPPRSVVLDVAVLADSRRAVRRRALRAAIVAAGAPPQDVGRHHVLALEALVLDWHGQGPLDLPGGVGARRVCGTLELGRRTVAPST